MPIINITAFSSPIADSGIADYRRGTSFGPRCADDWEFVWMIEGAAEWIRNGERIAVPPGSVLLSQPGTTELFHWDRQQSTQHGFVHFTLQGHETHLPDMAQWPLLVTAPNREVLTPLLRNLLVLLARDDTEAHRMAEHNLALIVQLFVYGCWQLIDDIQTNSQHPLIGKLIAFIHKRWSRDMLSPITDRELAHAGNISVGHLIRIFRSEYDTTPQKALRLLRLDRASILLLRSNTPIHLVAENCGFENPFHFSRRFKETYGLSPRHFRQQCYAGAPRPLISTKRLRYLAYHMWLSI